MKLNDIANYFVESLSENEGSPRVFHSPITINSVTAKTLLNKQLKRKGEELVLSSLFHACYDHESKIIYFPDSDGLSKDRKRFFLDAIKLRIIKDFGTSMPLSMVVDGSPYSSLRVRSVDSFNRALGIINEYHGKTIESIPVIEANLERMPTTLSTLPDKFSEHKDCLGSYISQSDANSISFVDEIDNSGKKRKDSKHLLDQKTPFILINVSRQTEITAEEKDWVVLSGYRDFLFDDKHNNNAYANTAEYRGLEEYTDLYAIKRSLYLGWPFEEVSGLLLQNVKDFGELMQSIDLLGAVAWSLVNDDGHKDPAEHPYYLSLKIDPEKFPLNIIKTLHSPRQYENFKILNFDTKTSTILIKTTVLIPPSVCYDVLKGEEDAFVCQYDPNVDLVDIKSEMKTFDRFFKRNPEQFSIVKDFIFARTGDGKGKFSKNISPYKKRKVSNYCNAFDYIKDMCERMGFEFEDIDVIVGPIERFMGRGSQGGYVDAASFKESNLSVPHKIDANLWITPPVILINSVSMPSYAEQTETLIHEYRHHIFGKQNIGHKKGYGDLSGTTGDAHYLEWNKYLSDHNEIAAHKEEIKYNIALGKSSDEIIRDKVGGAITIENYPLAIKFKELVDSSLQEIIGETV